MNYTGPCLALQTSRYLHGSLDYLGKCAAFLPPPDKSKTVSTDASEPGAGLNCKPLGTSHPSIIKSTVYREIPSSEAWLEKPICTHVSFAKTRESSERNGKKN